MRSAFSYFGLARKVRSPGFGVLNAGDAADLDVAVAFEPAVEPLGEIAQFHLSGDCNANGASQTCAAVMSS